MNKYRKTFTIAILLVLYALASLCIMALPLSSVRKRARLAKNTSFFSRRALRILGIHAAGRRITWKGLRKRNRNYLILSNHVSYVDILVLASRMPSVFITSIELRNTFPLGLLARFGGSIFVERRSPAGLKAEISAVAEALRQGLSVVLFPEGTTSDGATVRPFKSALVSAAIETGTDLLPVCLRYKKIDNHLLTSENRDRLFYHGGTAFFEHAPRLLALRSAQVELLMLRPINTHRSRTRKQLATQAYHLISDAYHGKHPATR